MQTRTSDEARPRNGTVGAVQGGEGGAGGRSGSLARKLFLHRGVDEDPVGSLHNRRSAGSMFSPLPDDPDDEADDHEKQQELPDC